MNKSEEERRLRRDCDTLAIVGLGVMAFGIWSALRTAIVFFTQISELYEEYSDTGYATIYIIVIGIANILTLAVDLKLRLYIGHSARAEGLKGESKKGYLFATAFLVLVCLIYLVTLFFIIFSSNPDLAELNNSDDVSLSGIIIELTSLVTLIEMMTASVRVKHIRRKLAKEE